MFNAGISNRHIEGSVMFIDWDDPSQTLLGSHWWREPSDIDGDKDGQLDSMGLEIKWFFCFVSGHTADPPEKEKRSWLNLFLFFWIGSEKCEKRQHLHRAVVPYKVSCLDHTDGPQICHLINFANVPPWYFSSRFVLFDLLKVIFLYINPISLYKKVT